MVEGRQRRLRVVFRHFTVFDEFYGRVADDFVLVRERFVRIRVHLREHEPVPGARFVRVRLFELVPLRPRLLAVRAPARVEEEDFADGVFLGDRRRVLRAEIQE